MRDFLLFWSCVLEDTLINFLGVNLIENVPKRRILCVRESPGGLLNGTKLSNFINYC